ncbi:transcriptional regulator [Streptomyces sp. NPDC093675]|uniref:transcriptional regulator n=1 Tax=Streptomyces sp. NPDC093675 TaxID=3366049 RepID=UPI00380E6FD3
MEDPPLQTRAQRQAQAKRVGEYLTQAAIAAGFDVAPRKGGRAQLAAATGLNLTTIGRTLDGVTLPLPSQLSAWASVLGIDHHRLLIESGLIPGEPGAKAPIKEVTSQNLSPDEIMDALAITDAHVRRMLGGTIALALQIQQEIDADGRGAGARG